MKSKPPNKKAKLDTGPSTEAKTPASTAKAGPSSGHSTGGGPTQYTYPTLTFPDLSTFPRISTLLSDKNLDILPTEDIDALQTELETLWSSTAMRIRTLQKEILNLSNFPGQHHTHPNSLVAAILGDQYDPVSQQDKINAVATIIDSGHGTRTSVSAAAKLVMASQAPIPSPGQSPSPAPSTSTSRKVKEQTLSISVPSPSKEKQPKKKLKGEKSMSVNFKKSGKEKPGRQGEDSSQKQEMPNQFWDFVEPYCHEITEEDISALEELIEEHKNIPENFYEIPPMGKPGAGTIAIAASSSTSSASGSNSISNKKGDNKRKSEIKDVCGPLTQRLVAALVEDRVTHFNNQHNHNSNNGTTKEEPTDSLFSNRPGLIRALGFDSGNMSNSTGPPLEIRLRHFLSDQSFFNKDLDDEDLSYINTSDEVLTEIKRTQYALKRIHGQNMEQLNEYLDLAKKELIRVNLRKELEIVDEEIQEWYKFNSGAKLKKKPLTKKERDGMTKALDMRNIIINKLSSPSPNSESAPSINSSTD